MNNIVLQHFKHRSGSECWPPAYPSDSPYDTFTCKKCGEELELLMWGSSTIGMPSLHEQAEDQLIRHLEVHKKLDSDKSSSTCKTDDHGDMYYRLNVDANFNIFEELEKLRLDHADGLCCHLNFVSKKDKQCTCEATVHNEILDRVIAELKEGTL